MRNAEGRKQALRRRKASASRLNRTASRFTYQFVNLSICQFVKKNYELSIANCELQIASLCFALRIKFQKL